MTGSATPNWSMRLRMVSRVWTTAWSRRIWAVAGFKLKMTRSARKEMVQSRVYWSTSSLILPSWLASVPVKAKRPGFSLTPVP
jgi:hypothetical protein